MTHNEKREYLIKVLLSELPRYGDVKIPDNEDEQKKLIRDYLNARLSLPENAALILTEDEKDIFVTRILASV